MGRYSHSGAEDLIMSGVFCQRCGRELLPDAVYCARCGEAVGSRRFDEFEEERWEEASDRSRLVALLLCILLGYLGVHRFYVGKIGTGILWLLTGGMFGIGYVIDAVLIAAGNFRDSNGLPLIFWDSAVPLFSREQATRH
jgi:hypothetical protein